MSVLRCGVLRAAAALALVGPAALAAAQGITLSEAWMRPAYQGQPTASLYVDIASAEALKLVGARSPLATRAEIILAEIGEPDPSKHKVVKELPVPANAQTRLAYLGNHVRLHGIKRDLKPGERVPVTLVFVGADGKQRTASTEALIRGLSARRPDPEDKPAAKP